MSTQMTKNPPLRGYRRRKAGLNLDLNNEPPVENRDHEGTSTQVVSQQVGDSHQGQQPLQHATIDVEAIDDDVTISSPRAFAEAKNKSRRNQSRTVVVDVESVVSFKGMLIGTVGGLAMEGWMIKEFTLREAQ